MPKHDWALDNRSVPSWTWVALRGDSAKGRLASDSKHHGFVSLLSGKRFGAAQ